MTKKITRIDCCEHCPLKEQSGLWYLTEYQCTHAGSMGMQLVDLSIVHSACLLEEE